VASTNLTFSSTAEHRTWLQQQAALPAGFRVGTAAFDFTPAEAPKPARMTVSLITLDEPTPDFGAVFTRNAFPGAPVVIGRRRLDENTLGAFVINNKISNVCVPDGETDAESVCAAVAGHLGMKPAQILPSSTGVIGWKIPVAQMIAALPAAHERLQAETVLPAAEGIMTTDLYPKVRSVELGGGRIVGIAKGAGMVEPNLATMLVFILTDIALPREDLRKQLQATVNQSFNRISIDSDTSTSDTVAIASSGRVDGVTEVDFASALQTVCHDLAEDVVRNGEGVRHVIRVQITGAADEVAAATLGRAIVNAPLFKCAIAGNDPNVGRLVQAIGRHLGHGSYASDLSRLRLTLGGIEIFANGVFQLDPAKEEALQAHLKQAELYRSEPTPEGSFLPPVDYPTHERCVEVGVELGAGSATATVLGGDLTHEYVTENADYRS
jgi:glutamate N-acetyltransferase/amino-acid N-acetyltransferase